MDSTDKLILHDRREATRFGKTPDTQFAALWLPDGRTILAEVRDESLGGLGLLLHDADLLPVGQQFEIVFAGNSGRGQVRHMQQRDDGLFLVGLECEFVGSGTNNPPTMD